MTIVKIQTPIVSSHPGALALVYAKGHDRVSHQPLRAETIAAMDGHPKAFFEAEWTGDHWQIGPRAEWQDW
jgi:hypothetical protein